MEKHPDNLAIALDARAKGIVAIPCFAGTKIPALTTWKEWQTAMPSVELLREWFSVRRNIAIITTGMVLFDAEDEERAALVQEHCGDTPHRLSTPGGGEHLGYRLRKGCVLSNKVRIKGLPIDIKTNRGLEMIPNSATEKGRYEWLGPGLLPVSELPVAKIGWTRERAKRRLQSIVVESSPDVMIRRARAYLACVEGAISGQGGHGRTFRVACKLCHRYPAGFGLSIEQALPLIKEWNEQCEPPWSDHELLHKLEGAMKRK